MSEPFYFACACTAKAGKLQLFNRDALEKAMFHAADGVELELIIQEQGRKRTNQQNRFFHGPVVNAFQELGWTALDAKIELCLQFLPVEHQRPDGSVVIVPGHTSKLTVEEFNKFLEQCIQYASENDVYIQDGEEWLAKHRSAV